MENQRCSMEMLHGLSAIFIDVLNYGKISFTVTAATTRCSSEMNFE